MCRVGAAELHRHRRFTLERSIRQGPHLHHRDRRITSQPDRHHSRQCIDHVLPGGVGLDFLTHGRVARLAGPRQAGRAHPEGIGAVHDKHREPERALAASRPVELAIPSGLFSLNDDAPVALDAVNQPHTRPSQPYRQRARRQACCLLVAGEQSP